ncbi:MAG TPA: sulfite exporter TauE/SafE family protein [Tepidisphaeraceae bacterium]|nr:sulfite exporter TauE/SafE family protein [Tepidisphaeraceae bacterium]
MNWAQQLTPAEFVLMTFGISIVAGLAGSLLGLGGGIIVVPALTLLLKIDMRLAIGASIVSVIATSSGAAAAYVKEHMANLRVAMFLEIGTTVGAVTGAFLAGHLQVRWLFMIFGLMMGYSAVEMFRKRHHEDGGAVPPDRLADRLNLHSGYYDQAQQKQIDYRVTHTLLGLALMYVAGCVSGLLGIGSGALKVPSMDLAMRLPIKASTATSNFMIGVTAAASAGVYFARGDINPLIAAPVAAGVLVGATGGSRLLPRLRNNVIRLIFVLVLLWISAQMLWKGLHA